MRPLIRHVENHLGSIERGFDTGDSRFQVVRFSPGDTTFVMTLGLSDHELTGPGGGKAIRHELLMAVPERSVGRAASLLWQLSDEALQEHTAYLRGQVIGPRGSLFDGGIMEAIYVANPVCLPDSFAGVDTDVGRVIIAWMAPISSAEAAFVRTHGWDAFEQVLVAEQPDLTDDLRESVETH